MYLKIDRSSSKTLTRQVYEGIKTNILTGTLTASTKLPSTRQLSKDFLISRNIILEAYEMLSTEGYLEASKGSGTYVVDNLFLEDYQPSCSLTKESLIGLRHEPNETIIDFRTDLPNLSLFPKEKWGLLYKQTCEDLAVNQLDYYEPRGCYALRYELCKYLKRVRGVSCAPGQLLITTGAAQAFNILTQFFGSFNKNVLVEDPLSHGITDILKQGNMHIHPVPVDAKGLNTDSLPTHINPSLIFTTPSHQFPTGALLPISRRLALIRYARQKSSYIVEDDYDSEFRFEGLPVQSLQSLDPERVIYVGTFSKILCPALRLGYLILPSSLVEALCHIKYTEDIHSPILEQLTLAKFIKQGYLDTHIRKSRKYYHEKSQFVIDKLQLRFRDRVTITGDTTGIHLTAVFSDVIFDEALLSKLEKKGLKVPTVEAHALLKGHYSNQIMIGYGNLTDSEIIRGIDILHEIIT